MNLLLTAGRTFVGSINKIAYTQAAQNHMHTNKRKKYDGLYYCIYNVLYAFNVQK
jgi:hypothetical protein